MKFLVILPAIIEDVTDRCIQSIDPKYYDNILIIDNSQHGFAQKYGIAYEHHPENLGCARSWNIGARKVLTENRDYLVVLSATVVFEDGMRDFIDAMGANKNKWGLETHFIWHLIALKRAMIERCGFFDENFYPGYYEDSDYIRRWELNGIHNPMSNTQRLPKVSVAATEQGDALSMKAGVKVNIEACRQYFIDKWGFEPRYDSQENRDKLYLTPFNLPENDIGYWMPRSINELKKRYKV